MQTAMELFAENGFHATSINQIALKAKISKGLSYNYFNSKNDILEEIIDEGFNEIFNVWYPQGDGTLTEEEFISLIEESFDILKTKRRYWKLFYALMLQPGISENFINKYMEIIVPMNAMLKEYIAKKGSTDPEGDLIVINSMLDGAFLNAIVAPEIFPIDHVKKKIINGISRIINNK